MPIPIPIQFLYGPAEIALKELLILRIDSLPFWKWNPSQSLSQDARKLLDICQALKNSRSRQSSLDDAKLFFKNNLCASVGNVLHELRYDTVLMLALITWHYDASSSEASQGLITFLRQPDDNEVRRILGGRYQSIMCDTDPSNFDFLLFSN
ncbi:unnamed protein product [Penicillium salamii]|nr:unnamed protein product [Penicillium salamii]